MNKYIIAFRQWYEQRDLREKILTVGLSAVLIYALFSLFLFRPINNKKAEITTEITELENKNATLVLQVDALNKLSGSVLYRQWSSERARLGVLQEKYRNLMESSSIIQWQNIIKNILSAQPNVTLVEVKNFTPVKFTPINLAGSTSSLYQHPLQLIIYSNYFDTITYLKRLEKLLPNVHWDSIKYDVQQYPLAKVEIQFSVIYAEKQ